MYGYRNKFIELISVPVLPFVLGENSKVKMFGEIAGEVERMPHPLEAERVQAGIDSYIQMFQHGTVAFLC